MFLGNIFTVYFGNSIRQINAICGQVCRKFSASVLQYPSLKGKGALNLAINQGFLVLLIKVSLWL
jgi:hypothetical protein